MNSEYPLLLCTYDVNRIFIFTITVKYVFLFIGAVITDLSFMPASDYQCSIHNRCEIYLLIHICCEKAKKKESPWGPDRLAACCFCRFRLSSPLRCLTSVFGMGTGVSIAPSPPDCPPSLQSRT